MGRKPCEDRPRTETEATAAITRTMVAVRSLCMLLRWRALSMRNPTTPGARITLCMIRETTRESLTTRSRSPTLRQRANLSITFNHVQTHKKKLQLAKLI